MDLLSTSSLTIPHTLLFHHTFLLLLLQHQLVFVSYSIGAAAGEWADAGVPRGDGELHMQLKDE
jgi:hypothetical protein